ARERKPPIGSGKNQPPEEQHRTGDNEDAERGDVTLLERLVRPQADPGNYTGRQKQNQRCRPPADAFLGRWFRVCIGHNMRRIKTLARRLRNQNGASRSNAEARRTQRTALRWRGVGVGVRFWVARRALLA